MALTDLPGVGEKTANKLAKAGITSERELARARRQGDSTLREFGSRVQKAARKAAQDRFGKYDDPILGVEVSEDTEPAIEAFGDRDVGSLNEAGRVTRNTSELQDASLLDLGRKAVSGGNLFDTLGYTPTQEEIQDTIVTVNATGKQEVEDRSRIETRQARRNIAEMGFDVAANVADADREDIKGANMLRKEAQPGGGVKTQAQGVESDFTYTDTYTIAGEEKQTEKNVRVKPREYAAAKRVHNARSDMSKRVDNRREAETVTGDFDTWIEDPSQTDFVGVDTPQRGQQAGDAFGYSGDETQVEAKLNPRGDNFRVEEKAADGGEFGRVEGAAGKILSAPQEQQRLVLDDLLPSEEEIDELGLEPRGPDEEFFNNDPKGGFL